MDIDVPRISHAVGTMPYKSVEEAMRVFLEIGQESAYLVPMEAGDRDRWIIPILEAMANNPALRKIKPGGLGRGLSFVPGGEYLTLPWYRLKKGHQFEIDLGYEAHARNAWGVFQRLAAESEKPLRFQVGIADPYQIPLFTMTLPLYRVFEKAIIDEVARIHAMVKRDNGEVTFQLDMPAQTVLVNLSGRINKRSQKRLIENYAQRFRAYLSQFPQGTNVAVHLCYGHKDDEALLHPTSVASTVALANALSQAVPDNVSLEYVHMPFATPQKPPTTDPLYYAPLVGLQFSDPNTQLAAGFAHKMANLSDQQRVRGMIERLTGRRVMISSICGFGEDSPAVTREVLEQQYLLTQG